MPIKFHIPFLQAPRFDSGEGFLQFLEDQENGAIRKKDLTWRERDIVYKAMLRGLNIGSSPDEYFLM